MAFDIWSLEPQAMNSGLEGKTILIYGNNNLGKTFQASRFPKAFLMSFEPGGAALNCMKQNIHKWAEAKQIWNALCSEKLVDDNGTKVREYELIQREKVQTIVIDTGEAMADLAMKAVATEYGVSDISEIIGKVNGYSLYRNNIKTEINKLVSYGYTVVFIMHAEYVKKVDEHGNEYDFAQPRGWANVKSENRFIVDLCDFCFYVEANGVDDNGDTILSTAYTKETKRFFARSRFWATPFKIDPFTAKNIEETIKQAVEDTAKMEEAEIEEKFSRRITEKTAEEWVEEIKPIYVKLMKHDRNVADETVFAVLGEGQKVTQCDNVVKLEQLFNKLDTLVKSIGI